MNDGAKPLTCVVPLVASIFLIAFHYPGTSTNDTYEWLTQARTGLFKDTQPLGAVLFFKVSELFYPGPLPFVAINIAAVCFSTFAVMRHTMGGRTTCHTGLLGFYSLSAGLGAARHCMA
jgi:hypothetical protein